MRHPHARAGRVLGGSWGCGGPHLRPGWSRGCGGAPWDVGSCRSRWTCSTGCRRRRPRAGRACAGPSTPYAGNGSAPTWGPAWRPRTPGCPSCSGSGARAGGRSCWTPSRWGWCSTPRLRSCPGQRPCRPHRPRPMRCWSRTSGCGRTCAATAWAGCWCRRRPGTSWRAAGSGRSRPSVAAARVRPPAPRRSTSGCAPGSARTAPTRWSPGCGWTCGARSRGWTRWRPPWSGWSAWCDPHPPRKQQSPSSGGTTGTGGAGASAQAV